jgi:DNA-binding transcriptional LysR family regulator
MNNLRAPYCFVKLLQHGTFTGAAKALNVPLSTLSREIAALERELKHPLLYRSTRQLRPTDVGQNYFESGVGSSNRLISRTLHFEEV